MFEPITEGLIQDGEALPVAWAAAWFVVGVMLTAVVVDRIARRGVARARVWQVFLTIVAIGLLTLFMMFSFPEIFFGWSFTFQKG